MADADEQDLHSRLTSWSKSPTPRLQRKSPRQIMDERAQKKKQKDVNGKSRFHSWKISPMVVAGLGLALLGVGAGVLGTQNMAVNRTEEISALLAQIEQAHDVQSTVPDPQTARKAVSTLQETSQKVADLQNEYRGWLTSTSDADAQKVADLHARLSELVPSSAAVRWFSPLVKEGSGGDGSGRVTAMPADQYHWESVVTYETSDISKLPIAWLCKSADGDLLAWTTATYDAGTSTFSDVRTGVTSAGARLLVSDDTAPMTTTEG